MIELTRRALVAARGVAEIDLESTHALLTPAEAEEQGVILRATTELTNAVMDLTVYGRQEAWEDSPPGWPQPQRVDRSSMRANGRPIAQWPRLQAGHSENLQAGARGPDDR